MLDCYAVRVHLPNYVALSHSSQKNIHFVILNCVFSGPNFLCLSEALNKQVSRQFYTVTLFTLYVPTCSVWKVILFWQTVWFTKSHIVLVTFFFTYCFIYNFILGIKKVVLYPVKRLNLFFYYNNTVTCTPSLISLSYATAF